MTRPSIRNAAVSLGLIGLLGASVFFIFSSDYYQLSSDDSDLVGAFGLTSDWKEVGIDNTVGAGRTGVSDAMVVAAVDEDVWLVDLDNDEPDRVLLVTPSGMPDLRPGTFVDVDGHLTDYDAAQVRSEGIQIDRYAKVEDPDAVIWADALEISER